MQVITRDKHGHIYTERKCPYCGNIKLARYKLTTGEFVYPYCTDCRNKVKASKYDLEYIEEVYPDRTIKKYKRVCPGCDRIDYLEIRHGKFRHPFCVSCGRKAERVLKKYKTCPKGYKGDDYYKQQDCSDCPIFMCYFMVKDIVSGEAQTNVLRKRK